MSFLPKKKRFIDPADQTEVCLTHSSKESVRPAFSIITSYSELNTVVKYSPSTGCEVTGVAHAHPIKGHCLAINSALNRPLSGHMCPHKISDCAAGGNINSLRE